MTVRRPAVLAVALFAAACQRNLEMPPEPNTVPLSLGATVPVVAPQQAATFVAVGGAGGYTYAFLNGNKPSGADASLDPATGAYVAGSAGSAVDVVEVTDAAGATATASISVTARIAIAPLAPSVAPGGRVTFAATGGAGGYAFALASAGSGLDASIDAATGVYHAGSTGLSADIVTVSDIAGATSETTVLVGDGLRIYPAELAVAPHESASFIALGGKPPYRFSLAAVGSGAGASIDADSGAYRAGDRLAPDAGTGTVSDVVRVTDSSDHPQTSLATVTVGERLRIEPIGRTPHPGESVQLVAVGGKPPYVFGFAAWSSSVDGRDPTRSAGGNGGNRSGGAIEAATGLYRPGPSPGAVDFLQVTDATGAPAAVMEADRVGGRQLATGQGIKACTAIDLDGDPASDVLFIGRTDSQSFEVSKFVSGQGLASADPILRTYFMSGWPREVTTYALLDSGFSGRDQFLVLGGRTQSDYRPDAWVLTPDLLGALSAGYVTMTPPSSYGVYKSAAYLDRSVSSPTWRFVTDAWVLNCPMMTPDVDAAVARFDWTEGSAAPSSQVCLRVQQFCPFCSLTVHRGFSAMAFGDFTGDAGLDLAWITGTSDDSEGASGSDAAVRVAAGPSDIFTTTFATPTSGWPEKHAFESPWGEPIAPRFQVARRPSGSTVQKDALVVRLVAPDGRPKLFVLRDPSTLATATGFDPNPGGGGVDGIVALTGDATVDGTRTSFVAWSGTDGTLSGFDLDWSTATPTFVSSSPLGTFPFAVSGACFADVNSDAIPDLVAASDWGGISGIELGDGANSASVAGTTYGSRAHQHGMEWPVAVSDFDGDGLLDAVVGVSGQGLAVMWGGGGQLAWGPPVTSASAGVAIPGDFTGDGRTSVLYQEKSGKFGRVTFDGGGSGGFTNVTGIASVDATGTGTAGSFFYAWAADLGTTATPGGDAMSFTGGDGSVIVALLHQNTATASRVVDVRTEPVAPPAGHSVRDLWATPVGIDRPIVAALASFRADMTGAVDSAALVTTTLANPDADPDPISGPTFSSWTLRAPAALTIGATPIWSPAGVTQAAVATAGTVRSGPLAGRAVFLLNTDRLYAVEVSVDEAGTRFTADTYPVEPAVQARPFLAKMGRLDATSDFHVIGNGQDGTVVVRRTGGTATPSYELVQQLGVPYFTLGIGPLAAGSPGDAVGFLGDFGGTGVAPEIIPFLNVNDGTGLLF